MISSPQWWGTLEKVAAFFSGIMHLGCPNLHESCFSKKLHIPSLHWHISVESRKIMIYLTQARVWPAIAGLIQATTFYQKLW